MAHDDLEEKKARYKKMKAKAVLERDKLENMRKTFSDQCRKVQSLEADVRNLKQSLADHLLGEAGL